MTNGDECRAKAAECDKKAEQAKNAEAKRLLQDAAKEWRTMAAFADRHVVWTGAVSRHSRTNNGPDEPHAGASDQSLDHRLWNENGCAIKATLAEIR